MTSIRTDLIRLPDLALLAEIAHLVLTKQPEWVERETGLSPEAVDDLAVTLESYLN